MLRDIPSYEGGNPFLIQCDRIINAHIRSRDHRYWWTSNICNMIHFMKELPFFNSNGKPDLEKETSWLISRTHIGEICQTIDIDLSELISAMFREGYNTLNPNDIEWWIHNENPKLE